MDTMTKQMKFAIAIGLQLAIIFIIIIFKLIVLGSGMEVMLRIAPVDPRDMLRGDYVTFQYDISNINEYLVKGQKIKSGDTAYVTLMQDGQYWRAIGIQKDKPAESVVFIKGKVESSFSSYHIVYGVEQFFIPEGKGRNFSFWNKEAFAVVALDDNGNSVLKRLYVNDKPWP